MKKILSIVTPRAILFVGVLAIGGQAFALQSQEIKQPVREALDRGDTTLAVQLLSKEIETDATYFAS